MSSGRGRYEKEALCFVVVVATSLFVASSGNFGVFYDPPY